MSETGKEEFIALETPDALKIVMLLLVVCVPCCLYDLMLSVYIPVTITVRALLSHLPEVEAVCFLVK